MDNERNERAEILRAACIYLRENHDGLPDVMVEFIEDVTEELQAGQIDLDAREHEETTPSLHIDIGANGAPLLHCFGGCSGELITLCEMFGLWDMLETA